MSAAPLLVIAARNVRKAWRTSLASLLSIVAGFTATVLFQGYVADAAEAVGGNYQRVAMLGELLVSPPGPSAAPEDLGRARLGPAEQAFIEAFLAKQGEKVTTTARFLYLTGQVQGAEEGVVFLGYGHDVAEGARLRTPTFAWNTLGGVPLQESDNPDGVLVGRRLAMALGCEFDASTAFLPEGGYRAEARPLRCDDARVDLLGQAPDGRATQRGGEVVGVVDAGLRQLESRLVVMPLDLAQELVGEPAVSLYSVALADPDDAPGMLAALRAEAASAGVNLAATGWREHGFFGDFYRRVVEVLQLYSVFLFAIVAFIGGMSVMNTVTRAVLERTREIGTLRSIGFRPEHIVGLFALEGFLLGLLASVIGAALSATLATLIAHAGLFYPEGIASFPIPVRVRVLPSFYLGVGVVLAALSSLASAVPALRAARMRVAAALVAT